MRPRRSGGLAKAAAKEVSAYSNDEDFIARWLEEISHILEDFDEDLRDAKGFKRVACEDSRAYVHV